MESGFRRLSKSINFQRQSRINNDARKIDIESDHHMKSLPELIREFNADIQNGLTADRAKELFTINGPNILTPPPKPSEIFRLIKCCFGGFSILIWVGAALSFGSYFLENSENAPGSEDHLWLGVVLLGLVIITGMFSYYQEAKTSKIMDSFNALLPQKVSVLRDGQRCEIDVIELVVGDVVFLEAGNRVPADLRVLQSVGLKVDNASVTGESISLLRSTVIATEGSILEARNMAFFSTNVVEGSGKGLVVACGDETVMGRVAKLTSGLSSRPTPLSKEIHLFMRYISCWAIFLGILFFTTSISLGYGLISSLVFLIGIIVANVPEGLLATVTVSLTLTAKKMVNLNCLVKNLEAIETLGCTSVICTDKTGTLTQNKMTVRHMWYDGKLQEIMAADTWRKYTNPGFRNIARVASLCNRAEWAANPDPSPPIRKRKTSGDASDTALFKCMEVLVRGGVETFRSQYPKVFEIPFNSTDKFQVSVHVFKHHHVVCLKGAPERVIERCSKIAFENTTKELTVEMKTAYVNSCYELARNGERILGFADLDLDENFPIGFDFQADPPNFPLQNLRLIGLISMMDPPRPNVPDAVYKCRCAGIKVIMVTGDHPDTAHAIAKFVGIITEDHRDDTETRSIVITGAQLRNLSNNQLDNIIKQYPEIVFARTSPVQKLQIVESCQRLLLITAATGDGMNDSPALKQADIGVSMGIVGSDVSKQVADLILLDDNFASIVTGIEEGRRVFDNLKSSIAYVLASNVAEVTPLLAFVLLNIPLPVGLICILCIDLGTDIWPGISLAHEKPDTNIMLRRPRIPQKNHLVTRKLVFMAYGQIGLIETAAGFLSYLVVMAEHGFLPKKLLGLRESWDSNLVEFVEDSYGQEWNYEQRKALEYTCHTAYFVAIVIVQCFNAIICKSRRQSIFKIGMTNWPLNLGIMSEIGLACVISYIPYLNKILKTAPLKGFWWFSGIPLAVLMLFYDEIRKCYIRKHPDGWWSRETVF